jgi:hypothetical protein
MSICGPLLQRSEKVTAISENINHNESFNIRTSRYTIINNHNPQAYDGRVIVPAQRLKKLAVQGSDKSPVVAMNF